MPKSPQTIFSKLDRTAKNKPTNTASSEDYNGEIVYEFDKVFDFSAQRKKQIEKQIQDRKTRISKLLKLSITSTEFENGCLKLINEWESFSKQTVPIISNNPTISATAQMALQKEDVNEFLAGSKSYVPPLLFRLLIKLDRLNSNAKQKSLDVFGEIERWNVTKIKDMSNAFCRSDDGFCFSKDISEWDVSNVTNMSEMFSKNSFFNQPLEKWGEKVSNVENMNRMFCETNFNNPLNAWNVSKVTNMSEMFANAKDFNGDISNWNVLNVTNMIKMFANAETFNRDISKWDVSNVTNMSEMFAGACRFNCDIGKWNVSNVTNMENMFTGAKSFFCNLSSWKVQNVIINGNAEHYFCDVHFPNILRPNLFKKRFASPEIPDTEEITSDNPLRIKLSDFCKDQIQLNDFMLLEKKQMGFVLENGSMIADIKYTELTFEEKNITFKPIDIDKKKDKNNQWRRKMINLQNILPEDESHGVTGYVYLEQLEKASKSFEGGRRKNHWNQLFILKQSEKFEVLDDDGEIRPIFLIYSQFVEAGVPSYTRRGGGKSKRHFTRKRSNTFRRSIHRRKLLY